MQWARPGASWALFMTASAFGLSSASWAIKGPSARREAGLRAQSSGTLLPALADGGWHDVKQLTTEFADSFRHVLIQEGCAEESLVNIGSHSLKATCLSWCAKAGVDRELRRLLGYHVKPGDKSLEAYSRDSMAAPLRALDKVLGDIMGKTFQPDATRSGTIVAPPSTSSSTSSRSSSSCSPEIDSVSRRLVVNLATGYYHLALDDNTLVCGKCWR